MILISNFNFLHSISIFFQPNHKYLKFLQLKIYNSINLKSFLFTYTEYRHYEFYIELIDHKNKQDYLE
nr:MAG TPA: hypothetical protein [Caudoviricetes sp.]